MIPGLPEAARKAAERPDEVAMTQAMDDASVSAGDSAEPSWAALAKIVSETRFAFTCRRLDFMRNLWSVPTDEYWKEIRPLVAAHRFRPLLEAYATGPFSPAVQAFMADIDTTDLGFNYMQKWWATIRPSSPRWPGITCRMPASTTPSGL